MSVIEEIFSHETSTGTQGTLGIDRDNKLYWNGRAIVTEERITLATWVNISIIVTAVSTLAMAVVSVLGYTCK